MHKIVFACNFTHRCVYYFGYLFRPTMAWSSHRNYDSISTFSLHSYHISVSQSKFHQITTTTQKKEIQYGRYLDRIGWNVMAAANKCSIQIELSRVESSQVFIIMTHSTNQPEMYNWIEKLKWNRSHSPCYYTFCSLSLTANESYEIAYVQKIKKEAKMAIASRSLCPCDCVWLQSIFDLYSLCTMATYKKIELRVNIPIHREFILFNCFLDKKKEKRNVRYTKKSAIEHNLKKFISSWMCIWKRALPSVYKKMIIIDGIFMNSSFILDSYFYQLYYERKACELMPFVCSFTSHIISNNQTNTRTLKRVFKVLPQSPQIQRRTMLITGIIAMCILRFFCRHIFLRHVRRVVWMCEMLFVIYMILQTHTNANELVYLNVCREIAFYNSITLHLL